jgi:predicted nucleic acid-binding protein
VIVVSDTTPLSELSKVGQLILLRDVFGQVIVPQEVSWLVQYLQIFNRDCADRPARRGDKFSVVLPKERTLRKPNVYGGLLVDEQQKEG